jgi:hypothetical protein
MDSVVVSVRIKKATKMKLEREGVDIQKEIKELIDRKAAQANLKGGMAQIKELMKDVKPSKKGFAVRSVRWDRDYAH